MLKVRGTCTQFGCKNKITRAGRCEDHQRAAKELGARPAYHQLYANPVWKVLRDGVLNLYPLCVKCEKEGKVTIANVVDHMTPHRGDLQLFLDPLNLRPLCQSCHSLKTAFEAQCRKTKQDPRSFYD